MVWLPSLLRPFSVLAPVRDSDAIQRIFAAKGRPGDNLLIVPAADTQPWPLVAHELMRVGQRVLVESAGDIALRREVNHLGKDSCPSVCRNCAVLVASLLLHSMKFKHGKSKERRERNMNPFRKQLASLRSLAVCH